VEVEEDKGRALLGNRRPRLADPGSLLDGEPVQLEVHPADEPQRGVVFDNENRPLSHGRRW
jgi:hypothetical protein